MSPDPGPTAAGAAAGTAGGTQSPAAGPAPDGRGGDPVCWLHMVCQRCGTLAEARPPAVCPSCREPIPARD